MLSPTQAEYPGIKRVLVSLYVYDEKVLALYRQVVREQPGLPWPMAWSEAEKRLAATEEEK